MSLQALFDRYEKLVLFDTETTGLQYTRDEIIEFAAVVLTREGGEVVQYEYDELIALSPGNFVPEKITQLTGIRNEDLLQRGISKDRICADIGQMLAGERVLLIAYNAHFDLSFLYYLLQRYGDPTILKGKDKLDLYTVFKDRRSYPHKLCNAIAAYGLEGKVVNSHRAVDDVLATVEVMKCMMEERDDLLNYVNLFGYYPQYGVGGKPIGSVTYKPQQLDTGIPLYKQ